MRAIHLSIVLLFAVSFSAAAQSGPLQNIRWLEGCWQLVRGTTITVERWLPPTGNVMTGDSWTMANGAERGGENLRLFPLGDTLVYEASPSGQATTRFKTTMTSGNEIVFANPDHDFPQRIVYRRVGTDSVIARIEGDRAGRRQPVLYPYARVSCSTVTEAPTAVARRALQPLYDNENAREIVYGGATNGWFAEHAAPGFRHLNFAAAGATVPVGTAPILARADSAMKANPNRAPVTNRKFNATVEQLLITADSIDALVSVTQSWNAADSTGATLSRSSVQRRIDKWVRTNGALKLREVVIVSFEAFLEGKLVSKNGRTIPPAP